MFVVSLLLDDVHAMYVSHARLCSGGNVKCRRRFETSLFSRVWRILLVNTESGALLFDERRTQRQKERESFILRPSLSSIARISILVREKSASLFSSHRAGEINRTDRITSRRVNAYIYTQSVIMATKVQRIMTQPINLIFRFLQTKSRVQIWLYEHAANGDVLEGQIVGFDEYMNLVLDDCEEVKHAGGAKQRTRVGRVLLKGDSVTMMVKVDK